VKHGQHKLSDAQVKAIFHDRRMGKVVAANHNISQQMVSKIKRGQAYMELTKLPPRRPAVTVKLSHQLTNGEHINLHVTIGIVGSHVVEVFCANPMKGSDLDALLTDGAILVSLLLQAGLPLTTIAAKLGDPPSPLGTIIRGAIVIDEEQRA
jgi:hypothetical protein